MDTIKTVKELAEIMKENGLSYLKYKGDDFEVEMGEKKPQMPPMPSMMPPVAAPAAPMAMAVATAPGAEAAAQVSPAAGNVMKAPIVGTFYAAPAPGKAPFVTVGSTVSKGDVLFIIESMKVMNEVTSEFDGKVTEILVKDGDAVEYDQPVLRIE
ncbi:MAG: acetyl-CoA carboxylase biotin carboxyl carrier protein [Ruminiclostridium sp.]|nr:acetyl-CoA carboxylase biotin carboxyl carrier protein [Ruminiclostridium sp.]